MFKGQGFQLFLGLRVFRDFGVCVFMVQGFWGLECLGCLGLWFLGILGFRVF